MTNIRQLSQAQSAVSLVPQQRLSALEDWKRSKESFTASYRFSSTATALEFITLVGLLAEKVGIYPHVDWRIDAVYLRLAVMSRDVVLAPARNDTVPIQEVSVQTACH